MAEKVFSQAELARYDGSDGKKAYVAIDGVVYDVSDVDAWQGGKHHGQTAGKDLSQIIVKAPHKKSVLGKLPVVGKYAG